jgi:hypothetical protein
MDPLAFDSHLLFRDPHSPFYARKRSALEARDPTSTGRFSIGRTNLVRSLFASVSPRGCRHFAVRIKWNAASLYQPSESQDQAGVGKK